jgi:hypothetical protein
VAQGDFYTFDEALGKLGISENKLKMSVSMGLIRAFREGDQMKFKKAEIDRLEREGYTGQVTKHVRYGGLPLCRFTELPSSDWAYSESWVTFGRLHLATCEACVERALQVQPSKHRADVPCR